MCLRVKFGDLSAYTATRRLRTESPPPCLPTTPTTFLFAYSNDLGPQTVLDTWAKFLAPNQVYTSFGNVRFDSKIEDDVQFHSSFKDVNASIAAHLPDPTMRFADKNQGSDVLKMLEKFLSSTIAPICGSRVHILLKRYPNETSASTLIQKLRQNRVYVSIISSLEPSGGFHPETMYRIATQTNGIMAYEKDMWMHWTSEYISEFTTAYTIYAANVKVSGKGSVNIPDIVSPCSSIYCYYTVSMTIQDHGSLDTFKSVKLTWQNTTENTSGYLDDANNYLLSSKGTLYAITDMNLEPLIYSMKLTYAYSDSKAQTLQIRVYAREPFSDWISYP